MLWTFFTLLYFNTPEKKRAWQCEVITCLLQFYVDLVQLSTENNFKKIFRGTQREILRKRPKNNNKAWLKISEAILSILGKICLLNILRYILSLAYWNLYCHKKEKWLEYETFQKPLSFAPQEEKSTSISTYRPSTYLLVITIGHGVQATTKRFCSIAVLCVSFTRQIVKTRVIRFPVIANPNARVQIEFSAFHSFLVEVQARHLSYLKLRQIRINSLCHSESVISHSTEVRGVEEH